MKFRKLFIVVPLALGLTAMMLMLTLLNDFRLSGQSPELSQPSLDDPTAWDNGKVMTVFARRAISIPFGIDDALPLSADGQVIRVSGHGECPEGAETFRLNVKVNQDLASTPAKGKIEGACPGGSKITWTADAIAPGPIAFEPGRATACGRVVIHFEKEGALTFRWCKAVTLE